MVSVEELELAFFIQYSRPVIPAAVGSVSVAADVPVNTRKLSVAAAVVLPVKLVTAVDSDPLTSSVELGLVVPIPTCACKLIQANRKTMANSFLIDWILVDSACK